MVDTMVSSSY